MNHFTEAYLYLPRKLILNHQKRKHRTDNFRTIYYYRNKKKYSFNYTNIEEIDIYDFKELQKDFLYKSCFHSNKDEYFDWFYMLKPEYNDCKDGIFIKNDGKRAKKNEDSLSEIVKSITKKSKRGQIIVEFN